MPEFPEKWDKPVPSETLEIAMSVNEVERRYRIGEEVIDTDSVSRLFDSEEHGEFLESLLYTAADTAHSPMPTPGLSRQERVDLEKSTIKSSLLDSTVELHPSLKYKRDFFLRQLDQMIKLGVIKVPEVVDDAEENQ